MQQDQPNTKEKTMNAKHKINNRIVRKPGWKRAGLFVLAAILVLGFTAPLRAVAAGVYAVISVPVKLHHISGKTYTVTCFLVNKSGVQISGWYFSMTPHRPIPPSGNIDTTEKLSLSTLKGTKMMRQIRGWFCELLVDGIYGIPHKPGTTYRVNVSGKFSGEGKL